MNNRMKTLVPFIVFYNAVVISCLPAQSILPSNPFTHYCLRVSDFAILPAGQVWKTFDLPAENESVTTHLARPPFRKMVDEKSTCIHLMKFRVREWLYSRCPEPVMFRVSPFFNNESDDVPCFQYDEEVRHTFLAEIDMSIFGQKNQGESPSKDY